MLVGDALDTSEVAAAGTLDEDGDTTAILVGNTLSIGAALEEDDTGEDPPPLAPDAENTSGPASLKVKSLQMYGHV